MTQRARVRLIGLSTAAVFSVLISCSPRHASIEGIVLLPDSDDHEGTQVYIPGTPYQAITDRDGNFLFPQIPSGDYELVVRREGYREYRKPGILARAGSPLRLIAFTLEPMDSSKDQGGLEGLVRLEDESSPIGGVVIVEDVSRIATVDEAGHFAVHSLKEGDYSLVAVKAGYVAARLSAKVVAGATTTLEPLTLAVAGKTVVKAARGRIIGQVNMLDDRSRTGVLVVVEGTDLMASTDAEGAFAIADVPSGTHSVRFQKDRYFPIRKTSVLVEPGGETTLEVTLRPVPSDSIMSAISANENIGAIRGFIAIPGASALAGVEAVLDPLGLTAFTLADGQYLFPAVPEGVYSITARAEGYRSGILMGIRVETGQESFAPQLILEPIPLAELPPEPVSVEGTALLEGEDRHLGVLVALVDTQHTALTATDGRFRLEEVMPGEYELLAVKEGFEPVEMPISVPTTGDLVMSPITLARVIIRPTITETVPADGERGVPVDDYVDIIIQFDQMMDGDSVKRSFRISPPVAHRMYFGAERGPEAFQGLWANLRADADAFMLQRVEEPATSFDRLVVRLFRYDQPPVELGQTYRVLITEQAQNPLGVSIAEPYEFTFTTGGARLTASWPEDGATGIYLLEYDSLVFDFNARIDRESFERAFRIRPEPPSVPYFLPERAPSGDRVKVELVLNEGTDYSVEIGRAVRTMDGDKVENLPYRIQFHTALIEDMGDDYEDLFEGEFGGGSTAVRRHLQRRAERDRRRYDRRVDMMK